MHLDFSTIAGQERYKLLTALIVPRPIAWVTSRNPDGSINAAPFSFFNCMGSDPALIFISFSAKPETPHSPGSFKDTSNNIAATGEFVVNLVSQELAQQMNICATDFPPGVSEVEMAQLELAPSVLIETPRLAASPASFECREDTRLEIGNNHILIGEVLGLSIRDDLFDPEKFYVDTAALHLVGRMGGRGGYTTTRDTFEIPRMTYPEWQAQNREVVPAQAGSHGLTHKEQIILARCREMAAANVPRHAIIAFAARQALPLIEVVKMVRELYAISLGEAKDIVADHPAYEFIHKNNAPTYDAALARLEAG